MLQYELSSVLTCCLHASVFTLYSIDFEVAFGNAFRLKVNQIRVCVNLFRGVREGEVRPFDLGRV